MSVSLIAKTEKLPLLSTSVTMPITGRWYADVVVSGEPDLTGQVSIEDDGVRFEGSVLRGKAYANQWIGRIVGGRGGLDTVVSSKSYRASAAKAIVSDLLSAAGETLASDSDGTALARFLAFWTRGAGTVRNELDRLVLDELGLNWRVKRDGRIWIGSDSFPEQKTDHTILEQDERLGVWTIGTKSAELLPGVTFNGRRVHRVVHSIGGPGSRTELWLEQDTVRASLQKVVRGIERATLFDKLYPAKVVAQNADGTLDLLPDDEAVRGTGTQRVPIRHGLPGVTVELSSGALGRVKLGFDDGDPTRPYAALWEVTGTATIGQLIVVTNTTVGAVVTVQFFPAGLAGDALAAIALTAGNIPPLTALAVPITMGIVATS